MLGRVVIIAAVPDPDISPDKVIVLLGADVIAAVIDVLTKAVVAIEVSLSPGGGVGAWGSPVNVGEASGALLARSATRLVIPDCGMGRVGG
jgi:hypothetical protein